MTVLVDTSVWIDHLRHGEAELVRLLENNEVLMHPWVAGELALGSLKDRAGFLQVLDWLPKIEIVESSAQRLFIEKHQPWGEGLNWVDTQLLAACFTWPCRLWTGDQRLLGQAKRWDLDWPVRG